MSGNLSSQRRSLAGLLLFANLFLVVVLIGALVIGRRNAISSNEERAENAASVLDRSMSATLDQVNLLLTATRVELEAQLARGVFEPAALDGFIESVARTVPGIVVLRYSNANGEVAGGTGFPADSQYVSIADREYFVRLRDATETELEVSKRLVGRTAGRAVIIFARPYRSPNGAFAGVVYASLAVERFERLLASLDRRATTRVSFFDRDFAVLAGNSLEQSSSLFAGAVGAERYYARMRAIRPGRAESFVYAVDGIDRIYVVRRLEHHPYWVSVGLGVDDALSSWRRQALGALALFLAFFGFTVGLGFQLHRGLHRQEGMLAVLQGTLEASDNGLLVVGEDGSVLHQNTRWSEMMVSGVDENDAIARALDSIPHELAGPRASEVGGPRASEGIDGGSMANVQSSEVGGPRASEGIDGGSMANVQSNTFDVVSFGDGRVFERTSHPMLKSGKSAGRVWSFRDVTARLETERRLRESEARFRFLSENTGDLIWAFDFRTESYSYVSPSAERLMGVTPERVLGRPMSDWVTPASLARFRASIAVEVDARVEGEFKRTTPVIAMEHHHRDGHLVPSDVVATLFFDELGQLVQAVGVTRDTTERARSEAALRESEENYKRIVENGHELISETDPSGHFVYVSPNHEAALGYAPKDLLGTRSVELIHPEDRASATKGLERSQLLGSETTVLRMQHKCGEWRWFESVSKWYETARGESRVVSFYRDITERKRVEETRERLLIILESSLNEVYVLAVDDLRYEYVNRRARTNLGYTLEEMQKLGPESICPELGEGRLRELVLPLLCHQQEQVTFETTHQRADGTIYPVEEHLQLVEQAGLSVFLAIALDITERRQAEAQRVRLEEQLRMSQKMEAIGILAGGIAHDFNNLLSVILNCTEFAMEGLAPGEPRFGDLVEIKHSAGRAAELTRQLLAFSRKQVWRPSDVDLSVIASNLEKMLRRIVGEDISIVQVLESSPWVVRADPGQIEQVMMNLVVNARDAMPNGGKITISTRNVEISEPAYASQIDVELGSYVELVVADTGMGMSAETLGRVFEPFFTTKERGKGTGLGLATVYGIVRQCGGGILVESVLGQGSEFHVFLPRARRVESSALASSVAESTTALVGNETVLVVEDDKSVLEVVRRPLLGAGYKVLVASSGDDAVRMSEAFDGDIALLLTDVILPGMNGTKVASRIQSHRTEIRVLYMSGYTDNALAHHGVLDPGVELLTKPFTPIELLRNVRRVIDSATQNTRRQGQALHSDSPHG
jgi:PAS domain S-box-containing protein